MRKGRGLVHLTLNTILTHDFFELDRYMRGEWNLYMTGYDEEMSPSSVNHTIEAYRIYEFEEELWEHHVANRGNGSQWDAGESISLEIQTDLSFDQSYPVNEVLVYQDRRSWKTIIVKMKFYADSNILDMDLYSEDSWLTASRRKSVRKTHNSSDRVHCNDCGWDGTYESLVDDDDQFLKCPECYGIDIDYKESRKMKKSLDWRDAGGSLFSEYNGISCHKNTQYCEYCYDCIYMLYANEYVERNGNVIAYTSDVFNPVAQMYFGECEAESMEDAKRQAEARIEHYCEKSTRKSTIVKSQFEVGRKYVSTNWIGAKPVKNIYEVIHRTDKTVTVIDELNREFMRHVRDDCQGQETIRIGDHESIHSDSDLDTVGYDPLENSSANQYNYMYLSTRKSFNSMVKTQRNKNIHKSDMGIYYILEFFPLNKELCDMLIEKMKDMDTNLTFTNCVAIRELMDNHNFNIRDIETLLDMGKPLMDEGERLLMMDGEYHD